MRDWKEVGTGEASYAKFCIGLAAFALFVCSATAVHADTALQCYKGDKNESQFVREISGANFQEAAAECNNTYGDCNGQCFGCYVDNDSTKTICVDSQGNSFTR